MAYTGINMENVKSKNLASILKLLNTSGPMSRKDIALQLGLTPATMTMLCAELLNEGILVEKGEIPQGNRAGRRKILLDINYEYRYVLTVSIELPMTSVSICDLRGGHCTIKQLLTDCEVPAEEFLRRVADTSKVLMWEAGIHRSQLLGAGVSVPGPVSREDGVSHRAYRIWDEPVRVTTCLAEFLDCPILLENNVRAFAQAELIYGMGKRQENLVFLKWGPGVGSAIIANGQIYESKAFKNAEIGHVRVEENGALCRCGRRGCLETRVSTHPLAHRMQQLCSPETTQQLWEIVEGDPSRITVHTLGNALRAEDPALWAMLDEEIGLLANVTGSILTMLAPDHLILYGDMFKLPHFKDHFIAACKRYDPYYNEQYIVVSELNDKIAYIGPLAVVVSELFYQ